MPADLDQFGRDNSHGTIIGWEGLVQLGHDPAYGRAFLQEVHIISGIGQIESGLHPCNPAAYDQYRTIHLARHRLTPYNNDKIWAMPIDCEKRYILHL